MDRPTLFRRGSRPRLQKYWREVRRPEGGNWADTSEVYLTFIPSSIFYTSPERVCGVCHVLPLDPDRDLSTAVRDYKQKEGEDVSRIASVFRGARRSCREVRSITLLTAAVDILLTDARSDVDKKWNLVKF